MADDEPPESFDVRERGERPKLPRRGGDRRIAKRGNGKGYSHAARKAMAAYVVELRQGHAGMRYAEITRLVMARFGCGVGVAEKAITDAGDKLRDEFHRVAQDAPRWILDGYIELWEENMRKGDHREARKTLDSVRDMFGIRGAVNVNLNMLFGNKPAFADAIEKFDDMSDAQLEALARLDLPSGVIDVDSTDVDDNLPDADPSEMVGADVIAAARDGGDQR